MSTSENSPLALEINGKISKEITVTDITEKIDQEKRCALCNTPIRNENGSKEHVIPNAIGGRKTVYNFICKDCNSTTGAEWDYELVTQLKPPCTLLNIRRQRGENQPVLAETVGGDKIFIHADGRMSMRETVFTERVLGNQTEVNIRTSSMKELKKMLPGLVRKYPNLDIDQVLEKATPRREYLEDPLSIALTFEGEIAGRSIVKSCLALTSEIGLHLIDCEHARDYLLANGEPCFGYYNATDLVLNRPIAVLNHLSAKLYWLNLGNWKYFFCRMPLTNRSLICSKQVVHTAWVRTKVLPFNQRSSTGFSCGV